ncbi:MAG: cyclic beta 1-2 glucan synthetase, partial [Burkholderiales bacterium]
TLRRFINAYQKVEPLSIGELWAVPITLRLALVENLRRLATRIVSARAEREEADKLADTLLETAQLDPQEIVPLISGRLGKRKTLGRAFVVQLMQRLREQDPAVLPAVEWLEMQLHKLDLSIHDTVHEEHRRQAGAQVTVGNIITSMRLLSTLEWRDFFETVSLIDRELAKDPARIYSRMDFATRDRYRKVVERIGKRAKVKELDVARAALRLAEAAPTESGNPTVREGANARAAPSLTVGFLPSAEAAPADGQESSQAHIGYFLIGRGLGQLESETSYRLLVGERLERWTLRHATLFFLGSLTLLTTLIVAVIAVAVSRAQPHPVSVALAVFLALLPASDLAISILNWGVTHSYRPRLLPKLDLSKGVPAEARTIVVVPVILSDVASVEEIAEKLEITYLGNQDEHIHFAILGDFADATSETMPGDKEIVAAALDRIAALNKRYNGAHPGRFNYFHRRRQWCETENSWIGWERKRGKLREFNQLLLGATDTSFTITTAGDELLSQIRYVLTLDADTQLPRETAHRLIGTAIHPLNLPRFDAAEDRVTEGYSIFQPRVSISLESASRSTFARIFSGNTGVDPYTTAASDVYQDLFGAGIYTGKGLYDVKAFEQA